MQKGVDRTTAKSHVAIVFDNHRRGGWTKDIRACGLIEGEYLCYEIPVSIKTNEVDKFIGC